VLQTNRRYAAVTVLFASTSVSAVFAIALVACSGSSGRAPFNPFVDVDADNDPSVADARPSDGAVADSGTPKADATTDAMADEGAPAPFCSATLTTANATILAGMKAPFSLAETELTLAWVDGPATAATVHIAERDNLADAFVETGTHSGNGVAFALERPILNPQGTGFAILNADGRGFTFFDRIIPRSPFNVSSKNTFTEVNRFLGLLANGEAAHDAVWGSGGRALIFGISKRGIFQADATLGADDFGTPKPISTQPNLLAVGEKRRRPSGVAPDNLALFYFDEVSGQTLAASRVTPFADFTTFTQIGAIQDVQVRATCKNLYFSENGVVKVAKQN
jgi:hypothetical protein